MSPRTAPFAEPFERFGALLERARATPGLRDPTAMALATADAAGRPDVRMVLLKGFDERGWVFYTNLGSRKARELAANPRASLCFYWEPPLEVQVRIEGPVAPVSPGEADEYYASRPLRSRIGAWASRQSEPLESYGAFLARVAEVEARFASGEVPRPDFWSGFRVAPERVEFWQGRPNRLHERDLYQLRPGEPPAWAVGQLFP